MKFITVSILPILFVFCSFGQLTTSVNNAGSLVQNVLLGPGVSVSNIQYNGVASAIGSFSATGTNLGISSGIVMTTGTIYNNGDGPHGPNNVANSGVDNKAPGLPLLTNLVNGAQTFNAAVLQFDFVPYSDTVKFKYVFGSEEYPEFVKAGFNDVFGFFISGPGISGQQNIAKLPGSGTPVTIDNVNSSSNSSYFVYNGTGSNSPYNSSASYIQYDGFTKPLEAVSKVECGKTYHLVIAVADAGDGIYDSGIFLEANSLKSKMPIDVSYNLSYQAYPDPSKMIEGCVTANFKIVRSGSASTIATPISIPVTISGTATSGVDYSSTIPTIVNFAAGQTTATFSFNAINDGIIEPEENVHLLFSLVNACGDIVPIEFDLKIEDVLPVTVAVQDTNVLCYGDPVILYANVSGGAGPYKYTWNTGETTSTISVSPLVTTAYTCTVIDNCLNQTVSDIGTVTVPVYLPITLIETPDITEICPYLNDTLSVHAEGGSGKYTYQWSSSVPEFLGNDTLQPIYPNGTTIYTVIVKDQCDSVKAANVIYIVTSAPIELTMSPEIEICPYDSAIVNVKASGGYGQYYYSWKNNGATTSSQWVQPLSTTSYTVSVSDECQTFEVEGTTKVSVIKPTADFVIASSPVFNNIPITFNNLSTNAQLYNWTFGNGNSSTINSPNNEYLDPGYYVVTLIATNILGCKDSISKEIFIEEEHYIYLPNTFTPDKNRYNNYFCASYIGINELTVAIYNRWGEVVFTSDQVDFLWDGTYGGVEAKSDTYIYKIEYVANSGFQDTIIGHVNLIR
jgi:gliding motility-associated-like protein